MKKTLQHFTSSATRISIILVMLFAGLLFSGIPGKAQIYEPEGLNMPGAWNTWINPPANNLVLASSTQVPGGLVTKINTGTPRWQTTISVAATGGNLTGGTYEWLFTSGSSSNYYQNKWSAVTIIMNTLQLYTKEGAANNNITLADGKWYTMNYEDLGYVDTRAIFMETSAAPVAINTVSVPAGVIANTPVTVNVGLSAAKCPEENFFLRYSIDAWATSVLVPVVMAGTSGSAQIPGQPDATVVSYYVFSTTLATVTADYDLVTMRLNNNENLNYSYTVGSAPAAITFANLQYPDQGGIGIYTPFWVFGQDYIAGQTGIPGPAQGVQAWVGYSSTNSNPATWTDWVPAIYNAPMGNNDEYKADIGSVIGTYGRFYYATRFKLNADPYLYGGYSLTGGGFWDGVTNVSGILDVFTGVPEGDAARKMVYPNPAFEVLNINLQAPAKVHFINNIGIVILEKSFDKGLQQVDVSTFKPGVYHLQIINGNQTINQTIIKR